MGSSPWGHKRIGHDLATKGLSGYLLRYTRDLPDSGLEPMSTALAGRFFTTEPPGKPHQFIR